MQLKTKTGQNAIEYLLLLALVVGIVLVFLRVEIPEVVNSANMYFNRASNAMIGDGPVCGDGICNSFEVEAGCCDCGPLGDGSGGTGLFGRLGTVDCDPNS